MASQETETDTISGHSAIYMLDKEGNIVSNIFFNDKYKNVKSNILQLTDTTFLVIGYSYENIDDSLTITYQLFDKNLNITKSKNIKTSIPVPTINKYIVFVSKSAINNSQNIITSFGYTSFQTTDYRGCFLIKTDKNLDSLTFKQVEQVHEDYPLLIKTETVLPYENSDTTHIFFSNKAIRIDNNLNILDTLPDITIIKDEEFGSVPIRTPFRANWVNNSLVIGGKILGKLGMASYSKNLIIKKHKRFSADFTENPAYYKCLSTKNSAVYLTGSNIRADLFWGTNSYIRVIKTNENLEINWDKHYNVTDQYYYSPFNILATNDGGCLIAATRNNVNTQGAKVDIYLLKLDSLGNYTPTNITKPNNGKMVIYPNPGNNSFTINCNTDFNGDKLILYNSFGVVQLQQQITSTTQTINTSGLTPGIYIYEIRNNRGIVLRGKWIKNK